LIHTNKNDWIDLYLKLKFALLWGDTSLLTISFYFMLDKANSFSLKTLETVLDLLKSFVIHLTLNKMEIVYFDWPISCIVWNLLDYFNYYESLGTRKAVFDPASHRLYSDLIQLLDENAENSLRFSRLLNFLTTVSVNSANPMLNNNESLK